GDDHRGTDPSTLVELTGGRDDRASGCWDIRRDTHHALCTIRESFLVVERSRRRCVLCGRAFAGRAFLCRPCADAYRGQPVPASVRQRFYEQVDYAYPEWSNTFGSYNP